MRLTRAGAVGYLRRGRELRDGGLRRCRESLWTSSPYRSLAAPSSHALQSPVLRYATGRGAGRARAGGGVFHKHNIEKGKVTVYLDELKWKSSHAARGRGGGERDLVDSTPLSLTPHSRRERPWWHSTVHSTLTDPCAPAPPTHNGLCPSANYGTSASAA